MMKLKLSNESMEIYSCSVATGAAASAGADAQAPVHCPCIDSLLDSL